MNDIAPAAAWDEAAYQRMKAESSRWHWYREIGIQKTIETIQERVGDSPIYITLKNVIGADMVCIIPTKDSPNNITTLTAMVIMFERMCLIAEYLRGKKK